MKDTFLPIHKASYLFEINVNNKKSVTNKKKVTPILSMLSTRARRISYGNFFLKWQSLPSTLGPCSRE
jgi:hypothetical protein